MSPSIPSIYNATDGPLPIDRAGRMLGARESQPVEGLDVESSPLSGHIKAERIARVDVAQDKDEDDLEVATTTDPAPTTTRTRKGRATTQEA